MSDNQRTQADIADRLGVSRSYVNDVWRGRKRMPVSWIETVAELTGTPLVDVIEEWATQHEMVPLVRHDRRALRLMARLAAGEQFPEEFWESVDRKVSQEDEW